MSKNHPLPNDFAFSQASLQAYINCNRQFYLRYMQQLDWPAQTSAEAQALEESMMNGKRFHAWVEQDQLGLDVSAMIQDKTSICATWWQNYLDSPPAVPKGKVYSEILFTARLNNVEVLGKMDRVIVTDEGKVWILDWKTGRRKPNHQQQNNRWQSKLYPALIVAGGSKLLTNDKPIQPEDVTFVYWYAGFPQDPTIIQYNADLHEQNLAEINTQIQQITEAKSKGEFPKTTDEKMCSRCTFRTYCDQKVVYAGELDFDYIDAQISQNDNESAFDLTDFT